MSAGKPGWSAAFSAGIGQHSDRIAAALVVAGFFCRVWLAKATFFNTDEAWHYSVANQSSLLDAYRASLTLAHPPLMVVVLYFWRHLGTSDLMIRLPGVIAGSMFCWIFYRWLMIQFDRAAAWSGLIFATLLPPMIALSAELRQYSWLLMFALASAYFLERALAEDSVGEMWLGSTCLWFAMLSHYSAFLFAAAMGIYAILRMIWRRPPIAVIASWATGQLIGVALARFLYLSQIKKLPTVYPVAQPLERFGDFYIADWYFHPGRDHLLHFLYRGTFGVFRFMFGQTAVGQMAALLFVVGVALLIVPRSAATKPTSRRTAVFLLIPFLVNWLAVAAGLFPYGRTRQCVFLAPFGLAGISVALGKIAQRRSALASALALGIVLLCQLFGTPQGRDMLPLSEQRREHMDQALDFIHHHITGTDVILTDRATSFQLHHYLCPQKPESIEASARGFPSFPCDGLHIVATGPHDGALTAENLMAQSQALMHNSGLSSGDLWIVQGGWASGLGEALRRQSPAYSQIQTHDFGRYLEAFQLHVPAEAR
jgi:hypothetical protein